MLLLEAARFYIAVSASFSRHTHGSLASQSYPFVTKSSRAFPPSPLLGASMSALFWRRLSRAGRGDTEQMFQTSERPDFLSFPLERKATMHPLYFTGFCAAIIEGHLLHVSHLPFVTGPLWALPFSSFVGESISELF